MDYDTFIKKYEPMLAELHAEWTERGKPTFASMRNAMYGERGAPAAEPLSPELLKEIHAPLPREVVKGNDFSSVKTADENDADADKAHSAETIAAKRKWLVEVGVPQAEVDAMTDEQVARCSVDERSPTDSERIAEENAAEAADVAKRTGQPIPVVSAPPGQKPAEQPVG